MATLIPKMAQTLVAIASSKTTLCGINELGFRPRDGMSWSSGRRLNCISTQVFDNVGEDPGEIELNAERLLCHSSVPIRRQLVDRALLISERT